MAEMQAELLVDCRNILGEGVQWSVKEQRVYWVDVEKSELLSCDEYGKNVIVKKLKERLCSFSFDIDGNILGAFATGLYKYHTGTEDRELISQFEPQLPDTRMNDGRCDREGRFIVGGYHEGGMKPVTSLISFNNGKISKLLDNVACANSIGFSLDCSRMYFADTSGKQINYFDYDRLTGKISNKTLFTTLTDDEGVPDGSVVDGDDALWNAQFEGGRVQRFLPDGSRDLCVKLPVSNATCACFGGVNLDKLFITTATHELSESQKRVQKTAGGLYVAQTNIRGVEEEGLRYSLFGHT